MSAFFEKCEEGRALRRERDDVRFELNRERKLCALYKKELERIKKEYGFYKTVDSTA
jgi:DNA gyrase/topoisomerase IV subunit A